MKLVGKLKENVEKAENKDQAKELIAEAGMELTDEEMETIAGGMLRMGKAKNDWDPDYMQAVRNVRQLHAQMINAALETEANELKKQIQRGFYKGYSYFDIAVERGYLDPRRDF